MKRLGVTARLLCLMLIPLIGLSVLVATDTATRRTAADHVGVVAAEVDHLARLADVQAALYREHMYAEIKAASESVGATAERFSKWVRVDVVDRLAQARRRVDHAVAELADDEVISAEDVAAARRQPPALPLSERTLTAGYRPLEEQVADGARRQLAEAEAGAADVPGGGRLVTLLAGLRQPVQIAVTFARQTILLELLYLEVGDPAIWRGALAETRTAERDAFARLASLPPGPIADAAAALEADPATQAVRAAVQRTVDGDVMRFAGGTPDWSRYGSTLHEGFTYLDRIATFVSSSADAVRDAAAALQDDAIHSLRLGLVFSSALVALTLAGCFLLARSISRPLRRLALQADVVRHGDLSVAALPIAGPHDIAVTSRAVNDLVDNLRLLEAKAHALAELDFDAPALTETLPGPLGESLQRSVRVLSGSVAERDELRAHLVHQATHDELTGLHSRASAVDAVDQALDRARRIHRGVAAILVDLHGFKLVNDTYGVRTGDDILVEVAERLTRAAGDAGLIARLGGDEFLVVVEDVEDAEAITRLAHHILRGVSGDVRLGAATVHVTACAGIAFCFDGEAPADQVMAWADLAVARAKPHGPGAVEIYDRGLQEQLQHQAEIEKALTAAIVDDELFLQYQPVIDLATGRMTSVEALVRWDRPGAGIQPPDSFIPVAERSNLILALDQWVLRRACQQLDEWSSSPELSTITVAVNVSGRHLSSGSLYDHLCDLLDRTGVDPRRLIIEITETVLVDDLEQAAAQLEAIRGLGLRVALDDFGTGYSSLAHLRRLPVDTIKLDRSFVARVGSERDRALLATLTELGHQLDHTITAEGVETAEQYDLLRDLGCDHAQGYFMSRPLVADALLDWAADTASAAS